MKIGNKEFRGWVRSKQCLVCGNLEPPVSFSQTLDLVTILHIGEEALLPLYFPLSYVKCGKCGAEYQAWVLSEDALNFYYKTDLYRQLIDRDNMERRDHDALRWIQPLLSICEGEGIEPTRHLDFGCGPAVFLRNVPWDGVGVEISDGAREYANEQGAEVYSTLDEVEGKFDFITLLDVLEHLPRPAETLEQLLGKLTEDGIVMIVVPWAGRHTGTKRLHHLTAFTPEALVYLTESLGLKTLRVMDVVQDQVEANKNSSKIMYLGEWDAN